MTTPIGGDQPGDWVTVYDAVSTEEAMIVKGHLESEDIPVLLSGSTSVTFGISVIGQAVQVQVPRALAERAQDVRGEGRRPGRV
jgi:hypothetical protein